jgi:nucleotide-binding universal stress UspA family protein
MLSLRTVLHPTDFSERAASAQAVAAALARDYCARLLLLHVAPAPLFHGEVVARRQEDFYEHTRERLQRLQPEDERLQVDYLLAEGDAVDEILSAAEENTCDLIVLGTHGRTGLGRLLMGSVAEQVLRRAPCPVLTVKTPMPEPAAAGVAMASAGVG